MTGATGSTDFPTINSFQSAHMGGDSGDVYVTKINSNGSAYLYSTYLGGSDNEEGGGIAIDSVRNAYVTGRTDSTDFPTLNALQNNNHGNSDVFLSKFSPSGKKLVYSTYLGGSSVDIGSALAVDSAGSVYLLGSTISPDFPTLNAFQSENRLWDLFITKVKPDGQSLSYSTYLGGSLNDSADDLGFSTAAIAIDALGSAYVTGTTQSSDFPLVNALPQFAGGGQDAIVSKISPDGSTLNFSMRLGGSRGGRSGRSCCRSVGKRIRIGGVRFRRFSDHECRPEWAIFWWIFTKDRFKDCRQHPAAQDGFQVAVSWHCERRPKGKSNQSWRNDTEHQEDLHRRARPCGLQRNQQLRSRVESGSDLHRNGHVPTDGQRSAESSGGC